MYRDDITNLGYSESFNIFSLSSSIVEIHDFEYENKEFASMQ